MQVGETLSITYTDVQSSPYEITGGYIQVTFPNTSIVAGAIIATGQNVLATSHTISFQLNPTVAGEYNVVWTFTDGTSTWVRQQTRFAFVNNVPFMVRDRLRRPIGLLPDSLIEYAFATICRQIYSSYIAAVLPVYGTLQTFDARCLDEGLAILTALRLRRYTPITTPSGELSGMKVQQVEYKFAEGAIKSTGYAMGVNLSPDEQWFRDAYQSLEQVGPIAALYATRRSTWSMWAVAGPSRLKLAGTQQSLFGTVAALLTDDYDFNARSLSLGFYADGLWYIDG
jgi:hypothetical protein